MMPGANLDALPVQGLADLARVVAVEREGEHAGLLRRGSDQPQPWYRRDLPHPVVEQLMLVGADRRQADPGDVVERGPEPDRVGDVRRPGLELGRPGLIAGPLERDVADHVAAALPRRHLLLQLWLGVERADT